MTDPTAQATRLQVHEMEFFFFFILLVNPLKIRRLTGNFDMGIPAVPFFFPPMNIPHHLSSLRDDPFPVKSMAEYVRTYVPKGHMLRKRCAQIKLQEHYVQPAENDEVALLLCLQGRTVVSLPPPDVTELLVPSFECMHHFLSLVNALPLCGSTQVVLILHTILKEVLESATRQTQQKIKSLLYTTNVSRLVLLNEASAALFSPQHDDEHESILQYHCRLIYDTCQYLTGYGGYSLTMLASDEQDPLYTTFQARRKILRPAAQRMQSPQLNVTTVTSYLSSIQKRTDGVLAQGETLAKLITEAEDTLLHLRQSKTAVSMTLPMLHNPHKPRYPRHLSYTEMKAGLRDGSLMKGQLFVFKHNANEGQVEVKWGDMCVPVLVRGLDMNRGMDGDVVIIKIHDQEKWLNSASTGDVVLCGADSAVGAVGGPEGMDEVEDEEMNDAASQTMLERTQTMAKILDANAKVLQGMLSP